MVNPKGTRRGTRYMFSKQFRHHGVEKLSTFLQVYRIGDLVDIKGNGAFQKGMPFKHYHGKTGRVFNVTQHGLGVVVNKRVRTRIMEKRINVRVEHVRPSKCRQDFLKRVSVNDRLRAEAKKRGETLTLKRQPAEPRRAHLVDASATELIDVVPLQFEQMA